MKNPYMKAAKGEQPLDTALNNIQLVNVFSGEIYPAAIGIYKEKIVHVTLPGETKLEAPTMIDGGGRYAVPGLIDTHVHIESSMMTPASYAEAVLPHGTTTVVTDPHEIGNIFGEEGISYMIEESKHTDLRILTYLPSCVPSAPGVETAGTDFSPDVIRDLIQRDDIDGLAEVMNYVGVVNQDERMLRIVDAAMKAGKIAQGHAPGLSGRGLSSYLVSGIDSDHECRSGEEALEKIRAGMIVEIRESSFSKNVAAIFGAIHDKGYLPNVTLCSDDVTAKDLLETGHINHVVRRLIEEGCDPVHAIQFATLNAANRLQRQDIGAIAPGRTADIALVEDLHAMEVTDVFVSGRQIVINKNLKTDQKKIQPPQHFLHSVNVAPITEADLKIPLSDPAATEVSINAVVYNDPSASPPTDFTTLKLPVKQQEIQIENYQGDFQLNYISVFHRHGKNNNHMNGILADFGIENGAVATTISHDSHHLTILGADTLDMVTAGNRIQEINGGIVVVKDQEILAELPLEVGGLMSTETAEELTPKIDRLYEAIQHHIIPGNPEPLPRIITVTLPVIPRAKMTDMGLVNVDTQEFVPLLK